MRILILFLSGIITALPMLIPQLSILSWIAMIPLIYILSAKKGMFLYSLFWGAGYYGVLYYWFTCLYPLDFAGLNNIESIAAIAVSWFGMTVLQSIQTMFAPLIYRIVNGKDRMNVLSPFIFAALWTLVEWRQTQMWTGVPWGRISLSQYTSLAAVQSVSVIGSLGLSFLIVLVNGFFALALYKYTHSDKTSENKIKSGYIALTAAAIVVVNFGFGVISLCLYKDEGEPVRAALVQGNISSYEKWGDDALEVSVERYVAMTEQAVKEYKPDIIVWPETVIPTGLLYSDAALTISNAARKAKAVILVGTYDYIYNDEIDDYDIYNAIVTFYPNGKVSEKQYYKRHLVPFGEYLPAKEIIELLLPVLADLNVFENNLTQGEDTALIETEFGKIGSLICFDSIYETLALESVRDGAQLLAISTNDSWYKDSAAIYQHNGHAVLRSIENGRYVVRAANTGMSTVIKPTGEIIEKLAPLEQGNVYGEVYFRSNATMYSILGNLIVFLSAIFILVSVLVKLILRIKRH